MKSNKILALIGSAIKPSHFMPYSAALWAITFFFLYSLWFAKKVFVQFEEASIFVTGLEFFGFFTLLLAINIHHATAKRIITNMAGVYNIIPGLAVAFFLAALESTQHKSDLRGYFYNFPLFQADARALAHPDISFHVSLIQSILNFGKPSISLHGHPHLGYHALSHYIDALFLRVSGIDPLDGYGLLAHFKIFVFFSIALLSITTIVRDKGILVFLFAVALLLPAVIGNWLWLGGYSTWSIRALWLSCLPWVISRINLDTHINSKDLFLIFLIITTSAFGKVSDGYVLGAIIGGSLLAKQPSSIKTYIFGLLLGGFFYSYAAFFFEGGEAHMSGIRYELFNFEELFNYALNNRSAYPFSKESIWSIALILIAGFACMEPKVLRYIFGLLIAFLATFSLRLLNINATDLAYFEFALSFFSLTIAYSLASQLFIKQINTNLTTTPNQKPILSKLTETLQTSLFLICIVFIGHVYQKPYLNLFNAIYIDKDLLYNEINESPYNLFNGALAGRDKILLFSEDAEIKRKILAWSSRAQNLSSFKAGLNDAITKSGLSRSDVALYIPKDIYQGELTQRINGQSWMVSLAVHAITGIQLVHGREAGFGGYGFQTYLHDPASLRINPDQFSLKAACTASGSKAIIAVRSVTPLKIDVLTCHISS